MLVGTFYSVGLLPPPTHLSASLLPPVLSFSIFIIFFTILFIFREREREGERH